MCLQHSETEWPKNNWSNYRWLHTNASTLGGLKQQPFIIIVPGLEASWRWDQLASSYLCRLDAVSTLGWRSSASCSWHLPLGTPSYILLMVMAGAKQGKEKHQTPFQASPAIPLAKGSHIAKLRINGQGNSDMTKGVPSGRGKNWDY